ncbi:MAG: carbamate kinase [Betaproteobacteria bacterium]|nr:carbamate kinase [Betaproteobacteria bacterium]MBV9362412.1 carbamate kinase [Betaproteobacteria bacterium]
MNRSHTAQLAVVAIGGNALIRDRKHESILDQFEMVADIAVHLVEMIELGWNVVLTHGNGPQIGFILERSEISMPQMPPVPMDYAGADIQGAVGWMFVRALRNEFRRRSIAREAIALVTQTIVDGGDSAFTHPSKPIGSQMDEAKAKRLALKYHWTIHEDAGRGWRRVVPSPRPQAIIETSAIRDMATAGYVVIACGGGGIPVVEGEDGSLRGVEAVIDKDLASSLLARSLGADVLISLTGVDKVALNFNQPSQCPIDRMTVSEARRYQMDGQFDEGSMGPKVAGLIEFVAAGGEFGLICAPPNIAKALEGNSGTRVVPD